MGSSIEGPEAVRPESVMGRGTAVRAPIPTSVGVSVQDDPAVTATGAPVRFRRVGWTSAGDERRRARVARAQR